MEEEACVQDLQRTFAPSLPEGGGKSYVGARSGWVGGRRGSRRFLFRSDVAVSPCPKRLLPPPNRTSLWALGRGGRREADKSCAVSPSRSPAFSSVGGRRMTGWTAAAADKQASSLLFPNSPGGGGEKSMPSLPSPRIASRGALILGQCFFFQRPSSGPYEMTTFHSSFRRNQTCFPELNRGVSHAKRVKKTRSKASVRTPDL